MIPNSQNLQIFENRSILHFEFLQNERFKSQNWQLLP